MMTDNLVENVLRAYSQMWFMKALVFKHMPWVNNIFIIWAVLNLVASPLLISFPNKYQSVGCFLLITYIIIIIIHSIKMKKVIGIHCKGNIHIYRGELVLGFSWR
jgi:hypothetical protein